VDRLERLLIESECARLQVMYTHFVDFGEAERVAELFAEGGVFQMGTTTLTGRKEIRAAMATIGARNDHQAMRHVCTNQLITVDDEAHATGVAYFTFYRAESGVDGEPGRLSGPAVIGAYRDRFVRTDDGWRIALREAEVAMERST